MSRAGFVTLAGKPNAGKSTLLNRLIGERLSITSEKPQSTRDRIVGILTLDSARVHSTVAPATHSLPAPAGSHELTSTSTGSADADIPPGYDPDPDPDPDPHPHPRPHPASLSRLHDRPQTRRATRAAARAATRAAKRAPKDGAAAPLDSIPTPSAHAPEATGAAADRADAAQLVFFDTPGLLDPHDPLQRAMRATALQALGDADVIVYLADADAGPPPPLADAAGLLTSPRAPVILALNKIDALDHQRMAGVRDALQGRWPDPLFISALTGEGVDALLDAIIARLPESPFLYPEDDVSTQSVRFFVTELIRETALEQLQQELPYSVAAQVEEFREGRSPVYIRAVVYVERDSQKGILLGHKGTRIRALGQAARAKIERLIGSPVYLDLWVKVLPNWRRDLDALRRFGYHVPPPT